MSADPPTYSRRETVPPPAYQLDAQLPGHFTIGTHNTAPLVAVEELLDHLRVLSAFDVLKTAVLETNKSSGSASSVELDDDAAWIVFVCRAVHRFERWLSSASAPPEEDTLPPLDVLMVWHTYMLNPMAYKEDAVRTLPQLAKLGPFPLAMIARTIHPETSEPHPSSAESQKFFEGATKEPFEPPLTTSLEDLTFISCPCCESSDSAERYPWPWIDAKGTGWAQRSFLATCPTCRRSFNHEAYGVRKFCDEIVKWRQLRESGPDSGPQFFFAGLLKLYDDQRAAGRIMDSFLGSTHEPPSADWRAEMLKLSNRSLLDRPINPEIAGVSGAALANRFEWKMARLLKWANDQLPNNLNIVKRMLLHYTFPGSFSVELVGAVKRQSGFVDEMRKIGWTAPGRFTVGNSADALAPLVRSVARYHAFLHLVAENESMYLVPTLDIDLAWHTHQLRGQSYRSETKRLLGRTLDHEDKVEESALAIAFDHTAGAWMSRYDVPYSLCGCLCPAESTLSRAMRRVTSILPASHSHPPAPENAARPDLLSTDGADAAATHPSDHTAVALPANAERRRGRENVRGELLKKRAKEVDKGRAGPWTVLQHRRAAAHAPAFFRPMLGGGQYGFGDGGFVSHCNTSDRPEISLSSRHGGGHTGHGGGHGGRHAGVSSSAAATAGANGAATAAGGASGAGC